MANWLACPAVDGWNSILENRTQERACGNNIEYRFCDKGGVWATPDSSRCSMCFSQNYSSYIVCEPMEGFTPVYYGDVNTEHRCDNEAVVIRKCLTSGKWERVTYDRDCCT